MALLKDDGSLDIKWINSLPIDEFTKVYATLTQEQEDEYCSKLPINESHCSEYAVIVDYSFEDEIARGTMVDAVDFLNKQREKYGLKR